MLEEKGKSRSMDLHLPRSSNEGDDESENDSLLEIQVKESPVDESSIDRPLHMATPMPGEWKMNLKERIQSA